jgi:hypothetical protein
MHHLLRYMKLALTTFSVDKIMPAAEIKSSSKAMQVQECMREHF